MALERKRTEPLISPGRKIYDSEVCPPPCITFWGFFHVFCEGDSQADAIISNFSADNKDTRIRFLKQMFANTSVDPWKFIFSSERSSKGESNLLSKVWHLTWKYEKTPKLFAANISAFQADPELALEGMKRNISRILDSGQIDRDRSRGTAFQLLQSLRPDCLSGVEPPDPERSLTVLLLLCLLGEDVVFRRQRLPKIAEWLDRKSRPSGFVMVRRFRSSGLYHIEDSQINTRLLPSIVCRETRYDYTEDAGSPLRQIISEQWCQWLFLSGQVSEAGDSAVSGAGKTTSLRFLALEEKDSHILWFPLAEIYSHHNVKEPYILSRHIQMRLHLDIEELPDNTLLLLDGLDELVDREQLESLSGDLNMLQKKGRFGLVVSSKLPWEQLPRIDVFYEWRSVWQVFLPCTIQNLSKNQITTAMSGYRSEEPLPQLNTPFLLSLYLHTASLPDDPWTTRLIARWRAERLFHSETLTKELLFYRSLIVQIIRWHESAQGRELQWEMDAFLLLHVLPAIACQMLRSESNDSDLDPASAIRIDRAFVKRMIDIIEPATRPGLYLFPGYMRQAPEPSYEQLLCGLNYEKFLSGAVPSLFHGEWDGKDQYAQPRFVNLSLRDDLAFLHIANVFLLACSGKLETTAETVEAYGHTVELFPTKQLQRAAAFFDLITPGKNLKTILREGPAPETESQLSRFLAGQIGATMCDRIPDMRDDKSISAEPWYACMVSAFEELAHSGDTELQALVHRRFGLAYIYGQTTYARSFRSAGLFARAELCAEQVIAYQQLHNEWLINSDGYHMKALILLDQVTSILNGTRKKTDSLPAPVSQKDLDWALGLTHDLMSLAEDPRTPLRRPLPLSEGQKGLIPVFSMMLNRSKRKWEAYRAQEFFRDEMLEFLCSASYVAKANSIFAALSAGESGMAYNLMGTMAANDCEVLENDKNLPFFKRSPKRHLDIPGLAYGERFVASFQIFLQIYNIRRGPQPYSARRLCEVLLRRQVRLDETGNPVPAIGNEPFTETELQFLERATSRALLNKGKSESYWRARYLHELAAQEKDPEHADLARDSAGEALDFVWKKCSCDEKLSKLLNSDFNQVDFLSFLIILEDMLLNPPEEKEKRDRLYDKIFDYLKSFRTKIQKEPVYTTGVCAQYSDIQDCLNRIDRLKRSDDGFVVRHLMVCHQFVFP